MVVVEVVVGVAVVSRSRVYIPTKYSRTIQLTTILSTLLILEIVLTSHGCMGR